MLRPPPNKKAIALWRTSRKGKKTKLWWGEYLIKPPAATPFLAGDEAIRSSVATLSGTRLRNINRGLNGDSFIIETRENIFRSHASVLERKLAKTFLARVEELSLPERYVPPNAREACDAFLALSNMRSVKWYAQKLTFSNEAGNSITVTRQYRGELQPQIRKLWHTCHYVDPFYYEAAQQ